MTNLPPVPEFNRSEFARLSLLQRDLPPPPVRRSGRTLPSTPPARSLPPIFQNMNLSLLPQEVIENIIINNLTYDEIKELCKVDNRINFICQSEYLWKQLTKRDFNADELQLVDTWKLFYKLMSNRFYQATYRSEGIKHSNLFTTFDDGVNYLIRRIMIDETLFKIANELNKDLMYIDQLPKNYDSNIIRTLSEEKFSTIIERIRQNDDTQLIEQIELAKEFIVSVIKKHYNMRHILIVDFDSDEDEDITLSILDLQINPKMVNKRRYDVFQLNTKSGSLQAYPFPDNNSVYAIKGLLKQGYKLTIENGSAVFRSLDQEKETKIIRPLSDQDVPDFVDFMRKTF